MITRDDFLQRPGELLAQCIETGTPITILKGEPTSPNKILAVLIPAELFRLSYTADRPPCSMTGHCVLLGCPRKTP